MPLQNRVTPAGEIVATPERGTMMGNRGVLHENGRIFRLSMHRGWITCLLDFEGVRRTIMSKKSYTELFFIDEATAFSAGHRPCYDCQRERFHEFRNCWIASNGKRLGMHNPTMAEIDKVLHQERINWLDEKVTYTDNALNVAGGAFVELAGKSYLKWDGGYYEWTPAGYSSRISIPNRQKVVVLTPKSIVRCFKYGFVPETHQSLRQICTKTADKPSRSI